MISTILLAAVLSHSNASLDRALWVWHGRPLLTDAKARSDFFQFLSAPKGDPKHRISTIFLAEVDLSSADTSSRLGSLIEECHRSKIRVDYLCGEAGWAAPDQNAAGIEQVTRVVKFNASMPKARRFDGFQFDVEPYSLPGWPSATLRSGYLSLFERSRADIRSADSNLKLGAAIPRWYDAADLGGLYKEVLDRVDYVAVMDYVSTSENFVKDATNTVAYATRSGKKAWLGAEATELPAEPMATFYAKGNAALEDAFSLAQRAFGKDRGFAGVAVEYYDSYVALRN